MAKKAAASKAIQTEEFERDVDKYEETTHVYPIKVFLTRKRSRTLLFRTPIERDFMLKTILAEQGFSNQLD